LEWFLYPDPLTRSHSFFSTVCASLLLAPHLSLVSCLCARPSSWLTNLKFVFPYTGPDSKPHIPLTKYDTQHTHGAASHRLFAIESHTNATSIAISAEFEAPCESITPLRASFPLQRRTPLYPIYPSFAFHVCVVAQTTACHVFLCAAYLARAQARAYPPLALWPVGRDARGVRSPVLPAGRAHAPRKSGHHPHHPHTRCEPNKAKEPFTFFLE
jgi:hypothetical protein